MLDEDRTAEAHSGNPSWAQTTSACLWCLQLVQRHDHLDTRRDQEQWNFHQLLGRIAGEAVSHWACGSGFGQCFLS
jgi:hypothetical protein